MEAEKRLMEEKAQNEENLEKAKSEIDSPKRDTELERDIQTRSGELNQKHIIINSSYKASRDDTSENQGSELEADLQVKCKEIEKFEERKAKEIGAIEEKFKKKISKLEQDLECEKKAAKDREEFLESKLEVKFLKSILPKPMSLN